MEGVIAREVSVMSSVKRIERILVVVDPTAETHPAVERAVAVAKGTGMGVDLFSCHYEPPLASEYADSFIPYTDTCETTLHHELARLRDIAEPFQKAEVDINIRVAWDSPLHEGIVREALRSTPRFVMKETHYHSAIARVLFSHTDWQLIRECPVPLWLVKADGSFAEPTIMAAVDPAHEADHDSSLDALILSEALDLAAKLDGSVQAVHAFDASPNIAAAGNALISLRSIKVDEILEKATAMHESALADLVGRFTIEDDHVHMKTGKPGELLPYMAREMAANLVIMGALSRGRLERAIVGSTAEKVLDHLPCDVMIIKPAGYTGSITLESSPGSYLQLEQEHIFKKIAA